MKQFKLDGTFPEVTESFHNKVIMTLNNLPEGESAGVSAMESSGEMDSGRGINKMKSKLFGAASLKKRMVIAAVVVMMLGTTVFAAGKITSLYGSVNHNDKYSTVPTVEQLQEDIGFETQVVDEFSNGYVFDAAYRGTSGGADADGNTVDSCRTLDVDYTAGNDADKENIISLTVSGKDLGDISEGTELNCTYNGVDVYYSSDKYKFVPADYEMTEADKAAEASGECIFSYGTDKVEDKVIQSALWIMDGREYVLADLNGLVTGDELVQMAKEVIDAQ